MKVSGKGFWPFHQVLLNGKLLETQFVSRNELDAIVPADAVTASGSGVDPDVSAADARIQAHRIAVVRRLPLGEVLRVIAEHTSNSADGVLGPDAVNVLAVNLALDRTGRIDPGDKR